MQVANPWHEGNKAHNVGTVGPFYTVPERPVKRHADGCTSYRTAAGSILTLDPEGRAILETVGIPETPSTHAYRMAYPAGGGKPVFAFSLEA